MLLATSPKHDVLQMLKLSKLLLSGIYKLAVDVEVPVGVAVPVDGNFDV